MDDKEFRARMRKAAQTPGERFQDWLTLWIAKIGGVAILLWVITHLDEITAWLEGK